MTKPLRCALIGASPYGMRFFDFRYLTDAAAASVNIVAVADPCAAARQRIVDLSRKIGVYPRTEDLLREAHVDAAIVATSTRNRSALLWALQKGLDVYVEAPLALTYRRAFDLARASEASGKIVTVGEQFTRLPGVQWLKSQIEPNCVDRILGPIQRVELSGWGRSGLIDFVEVGTRLLAVALLAVGCGKPRSAYAHWQPDAERLHFTLRTASRVPVYGFFDRDEALDADHGDHRRASITVVGTKKSLRLTGRMLESAWESAGSALHHASPSPHWERVSYEHQAAAIEANDRTTAITSRAHNPTFELFDQWVQAVQQRGRMFKNNPFDPKRYLFIPLAYSMIDRSIQEERAVTDSEVNNLGTA